MNADGGRNKAVKGSHPIVQKARRLRRGPFVYLRSSASICGFRNSSSLYFRVRVAQFIFDMKRPGFNFLLAGLIIFFALPMGLLADAQLPKFDEVYQLLRDKSGLTETELDRAAVKGLLDQLPSQVVLGGSSAGASLDPNSLSKVSLLENVFAYFRVGKIESDLTENFKAAYQKLVSTNKIKGLVLDLRFATGMDYAAAAKTADLFIKNDSQLLRGGDSSARAKSKTNAITAPVAILVNHQTAGAAEALAEILRTAQVGVILGTNTAGQASVFKEFSLSNGQQLKIASAPVKLGNGKEIPREGLQPDIEIAVSAEDEKAYYENAYRISPRLNVVSAMSKTNNATEISQSDRPRRRLNEAELVRLQREGINAEQDIFETPGKTSTPIRPKNLDDTPPALSDPVLIRALDLLKGLAVIEQTRRP